MDNTTPNPQGNKTLIIVAVVIMLAVVGGGIMLTRNNENAATDTATPPESLNTQEAVTQDMAAPGENNDTPDEMEAVQIVEVEAGSFYYEPNEIRVKQGDTVRIVMNSVSMMHDFVIDELDVQMPVVQNGETGTVEFVADRAGTFEYYCSVGQHRAQGQVGTLIVE